MLDLVALSEAMNNCAGVQNAGKNHIRVENRLCIQVEREKRNRINQ